MTLYCQPTSHNNYVIWYIFFTILISLFLLIFSLKEANRKKKYFNERETSLFLIMIFSVIPTCYLIKYSYQQCDSQWTVQIRKPLKCSSLQGIIGLFLEFLDSSLDFSLANLRELSQSFTLVLSQDECKACVHY